MSSIHIYAWHCHDSHINYYVLSEWLDFYPTLTRPKVLKNKKYHCMQLKNLNLKQYAKKRGQTGSLWFIEVHSGDDDSLSTMIIQGDETKTCATCPGDYTRDTDSIDFGADQLPFKLIFFF